MLSPKWNMDMTIQSQFLTMHSITNLLYMLQHDERKAPIYKLSSSNAPKTQQAEGFTHPIKTGDFLVFINREVEPSLL